MTNEHSTISSDLDDILTSMLNDHNLRVALSEKRYLDTSIRKWFVEDIDEKLCNILGTLPPSSSHKPSSYKKSVELSNAGIVVTVATEKIVFARNNIKIEVPRSAIPTSILMSIGKREISYMLEHGSYISTAINNTDPETIISLLIPIFNRLDAMLSNFDACMRCAKEHEESRAMMIANIDSSIQKMMLDWWNEGLRFRFYLLHSEKLDNNCEIFLNFTDIPQPMAFAFQYDSFEDDIKHLRTKVDAIRKPMLEMHSLLHKYRDIRLVDFPSSENWNLRGKWWSPKDLNRPISISDLRKR